MVRKKKEELKEKNKKYNVDIELSDLLEEIDKRIQTVATRTELYEFKLDLIIIDLPYPMDEIFKLKFKKGYTFEQIRDEICFSERTIYRYYSKAMDMFDLNELKNIFSK